MASRCTVDACEQEDAEHGSLRIMSVAVVPGTAQLRQVLPHAALAVFSAGLYGATSCAINFVNKCDPVSILCHQPTPRQAARTCLCQGANEGDPDLPHQNVASIYLSAWIASAMLLCRATLTHFSLANSVLLLQMLTAIAIVQPLRVRRQ